MQPDRTSTSSRASQASAAPVDPGARPPASMVALAVVVYAERGDQVLLLKREAGPLTSRFFLPGGAVEAGELPEEAAARELREKTGLQLGEPLQIVGAYPMRLQGRDWLQLSYRGAVRNGEVTLGDSGQDSSWVEPAVMRLVLNEGFFAELPRDDTDALALVRHVAADLDRYLARTGRASPALPTGTVMPSARTE